MKTLSSLLLFCALFTLMAAECNDPAPEPGKASGPRNLATEDQKLADGFCATELQKVGDIEDPEGFSAFCHVRFFENKYAKDWRPIVRRLLGYEKGLLHEVDLHWGREHVGLPWAYKNTHELCQTILDEAYRQEVTLVEMASQPECEKTANTACTHWQDLRILNDFFTTKLDGSEPDATVKLMFGDSRCIAVFNGVLDELGR